MRWQDVSIPKLAERQAAVIRERQPVGPYHLLGWSNGGVVALVTAQVLERDGEKVSFLGLLDSQPEHALYETQGPTPVDELMAYIRCDRRDTFNAIPEFEREALRQKLDRLDEEHRLEAAIQWAREREFLSPRGGGRVDWFAQTGIRLGQRSRTICVQDQEPPHSGPDSCLVDECHPLALGKRSGRMVGAYDGSRLGGDRGRRPYGRGP